MEQNKKTLDRTLRVLSTKKVEQTEEYKTQFKSEYDQLKAKFESLNDTFLKWTKGELEVKPTNAPMAMVKYELDTIKHYLNILQKIAKCDEIDLETETEVAE